ncbi:endonuclease/exonuclease/phosphatase family protein [Vibrio alginolyticus]|nr:endonuclease/exonuclease/phosphatase family protein [Vibrio alginolyticus]
MSTPSQITFVTANLFNFVAPPDAYYDFENIYSAEQWQGKLSWTQNQLEKLEPDIIGLQEVFSIEQTKLFFHGLGYPYFATVDTPHVEDDYIYSRPVVAIASRYPIEQIQPVTFDKESLAPFGVHEAPEFSRKPIYAQIIHPTLGHIAVYVSHLKSQRPADTDNSEDASPVIARWLSTQQRGWEAAMLRDSMQKQYKDKPMPTVLMGDMNQPITIDGVNRLLTEFLGDNVTDLHLSDGWDLQVTPPLTDRPATHYHFSKGNVLDYILLSQEFDAHSEVSIAEVTNYQIMDQHLINPSYERDKYASDHAFVALTVDLKL